MGEDDTLGLAGRAARGHDQCVAVLDRAAALSPVGGPVGMTDRGHGEGGELRLLRRRRQALVDGEGGVTAVPRLDEGVDEARSGGEVEGDELPGHVAGSTHGRHVGACAGRVTAPIMPGDAVRLSRSARGEAVNRWIVGARPRTLPAAVVPVALGVGCAAGVGPISWWRAGLALVVSLALQVGVNYANDYSDGVRGTDDSRVGPVRLVASRLASPPEVKRAALLAFAVAAAAGLILAASTSWWLLAVGVCSIAAGWGYTGGPRPYGYLGLGEVFVFVFFGLVATVGTTYVSAATISGLSVVIGCAAGFVACALLVVNNLRDIPTDAAAGKRTVAVRLGDRRTRWLYTALVVATFGAVVVAAAVWRPAALVGLAAAAFAVSPVRRVLGGASGPALIAVLGETGRLQLAFGALTTIGLAVGGWAD